MPKIIITGASSGIGKALAIHLAKLKHEVIAVGRNASALEELQQRHPQYIKIVAADINQTEGRQKIKAALDLNDIGVYLVNNAGTVFLEKFGHVSEELWDIQHSTTLRSPFFLTQLLLPHLRNGRVLNISSMTTEKIQPGMASYGIAKSALLTFNHYANVELVENDTVFAIVSPGLVETRIQASVRSYDPIEFPIVKKLQKHFELGELVSPETVAKFYTWLLFSTDKKTFSEQHWEIYDTSHHHHWANPGEVKVLSKE